MRRPGAAGTSAKACISAPIVPAPTISPESLMAVALSNTQPEFVGMRLFRSVGALRPFHITACIGPLPSIDCPTIWPEALMPTAWLAHPPRVTRGTGPLLLLGQ